MLIDDVSVMIKCMTGMIIDVMSRAMFGIYPYAYL